MNKMKKVEISVERKKIEEEQIRSLSNMKHSSAKKQLKKVKSKYLDYEAYTAKVDKNHNELIDLDPNSRQKFNKTDANTFVPEINQKSKELKRELNISDHLYEDAKRLKSKRSSMEEVNTKLEIKSDTMSNKISD